jgi:hypothetical protein
MKAISQANQEEQMLQERKRGKKPIPSSIPGYVRFSEALSLFQPLSENVFNYRVRSSDIKHTKDEHGRLYEIESIDTVKKFLLNEEQKKKYDGKIIIDFTKPEDLISGIKLAQQLYNLDVAITDANVYQSWRKTGNQYLSIAAFSEDRSERFASIKLIPLINEQIAIDILSGKRSEDSIQPEEIRDYNEPGPYIIFVEDAMALPEYPYLLNTILHRWMEFWVEQYPERYIKKIYTLAVSESGFKMVQHFFMTPRYDLAPNAYVLDMAYPSASKIISAFKEKLEQKAPLPTDLQMSF